MFGLEPQLERDKRRFGLAQLLGRTHSATVVARWLVATGRSNQQIAQHLSVSVNTVETHLKHVFSKLGVRSRLELVGRGFQEQGGAGGRRPLR